MQVPSFKIDYIITHSNEYSGKRTLQDPYMPLSKRVRVVDPDWEQVFAQYGLITEIGKHLDIPDLLSFETVCKTIKERTKGAWICHQEDFPEWGCCANQDDKEKCNIRLTRAFHQFCIEKFGSYDLKTHGHQIIIDMDHRFGHLEKNFWKFSSFNYFLQIEMSRYTITREREPDEFDRMEREVRKQTDLGWGGELLLTTCFEIRRYILSEVHSDEQDVARQLINEYLDRLIEKKASAWMHCIYYYMIEDVYILDDLLIDLIVKAFKRKDFAPLDSWLNAICCGSEEDDPDEFRAIFEKLVEKEGCRYPLLLEFYADALEELPERDLEKINLLRWEAGGC